MGLMDGSTSNWGSLCFQTCADANPPECPFKKGCFQQSFREKHRILQHKQETKHRRRSSYKGELSKLESVGVEGKLNTHPLRLEENQTDLISLGFFSPSDFSARSPTDTRRKPWDLWVGQGKLCLHKQSRST